MPPAGKNLSRIFAPGLFYQSLQLKTRKKREPLAEKAALLIHVSTPPSLGKFKKRILNEVGVFLKFILDKCVPKLFLNIWIFLYC